MSEKLYEARFFLYADGMANPSEIIGFVKGLAKAGKIKFCHPDEFQELKRFFYLRFYAEEKTVLNWRKQMVSYGISLKEVKEGEL